MSFLERIRARVHERVREDRRVASAEELLAAAVHRPRDLRMALAGRRRVIAEVKLASPSAGDIAPEADPAAVASDYLANGAAALSIVTERDFFRASPGFLLRVRAKHPDAFLLMKDFVVDEWQLALARFLGADAVLLIAALLGARTRPMLERAHALGLSGLVEVHDEREMKLARGAPLVGINSRDLGTFALDPGVHERLASLAPRGATLVAASGLETSADLDRLERLGYSAFLVGTALMRTGRPGAALAEVLG